MQPVYLALAVLLCTCVRAQAQNDFQLFRPGVQYLYENPAYSSLGEITTQFYGVRIDSLGCQPLYTSAGQPPAALPSDCLYEIDSPFGHSVCQTADSTVMNFILEEPLVIYQSASVGDNWVAQRNGNVEIRAEVVSVDTATVLGLLDTVKRIVFSTEEGGVEEEEVVISRRYGLVSGLSFDRILFANNLLPLAGFSDPTAGRQLPPAEVYGLAEIGDTFQVQVIGAYALPPFAGEGRFSKRITTVEVLAVDTSDANAYSYEMRGDIYDLTEDSVITVALDTTFTYTFPRLPDSLALTQPGTLVRDTLQPAKYRRLHQAFVGELGLLQQQFSTTIRFEAADFRDSLCGFDLAGLDEEPSTIYTPFIPFSIDDFGTLGGPKQLRLLYYRSGDRQFGELTAPEDILISTKNFAGFDVKLRIFPNPVRERLTIELDDVPSKCELTLYNLAGTRVQSQPLRGTDRAYFQVNNLPPGPYMLVVTSQGRAVGRRMVMVQH